MIDITPSFQGDTPLYEQLYRYIVTQIRSGAFAEGEKLPSKRRLADHLKLSLTTIEKTYGILVSEGYLEAVPRSGYRVTPALTMIPTEPPPAVPKREEWDQLDECFSTSAVDTSVFPFTTWARLSKEAVYENPNMLQRGDGQGDWELRGTLANFLHQYRGVSCTPEQVVLGAGLEAVMWVLLQLLPDAVFALEDPGYASLRRLLDNLRRKYVPIPVDERGMNVEVLEASGANVAYVTPSHQFPLGVTTPVGRRSELLRWAYGTSDRYLIEDDYDAEFRYISRPIPAMQGMDERGKVIYMGTFSRTLAPSIRVAYLILPPDLLDVYREKFGRAPATVSRFEQEALRRFLATGSYNRHLRRVGGLYRQRRDALLKALEGWGTVRGADAGLHLLVTVPGKEESKLVASAARAGYRVRGISEYCCDVTPEPGTLVLGFAGLPKERAEKAVADLKEAIETE